MSKRRFFTLSLAAALVVGTWAGVTVAGPARGRRVFSYRPSAAAPAQARVQSNRRYSYSPRAASGDASSNDGGTLGLRNSYRPGRAYAPRQGINSANWKIQGL